MNNHLYNIPNDIFYFQMLSMNIFIQMYITKFQSYLLFNLTYFIDLQNSHLAIHERAIFEAHQV